jgi:hypothetical protein
VKGFDLILFSLGEGADRWELIDWWFGRRELEKNTEGAKLWISRVSVADMNRVGSCAGGSWNNQNCLANSICCGLCGVGVAPNDDIGLLLSSVDKIVASAF